MTSFIESMDKLAAEIAEASCNSAEAGAPVTPLGDKIDAFKALMPYYALIKKGEKPEDDGLPDFGTFASQIHATENDDGTNEPGVRGSRRNGN